MRYCKNKPDAVARIVGGEEAPQLSGCVQFYQENGCVLIEAKISGLPKASETGFFGFHIHQGRDCSGAVFFWNGRSLQSARAGAPGTRRGSATVVMVQRKRILVRKDRSLFCG